jgi:hypothetical protein
MKSAKNAVGKYVVHFSEVYFSGLVIARSECQTQHEYIEREILFEWDVLSLVLQSDSRIGTFIMHMNVLEIDTG